MLLFDKFFKVLSIKLKILTLKEKTVKESVNLDAQFLSNTVRFKANKLLKSDAGKNDKPNKVFAKIYWDTFL